MNVHKIHGSQRLWGRAPGQGTLQLLDKCSQDPLKDKAFGVRVGGGGARHIRLPNAHRIYRSQGFWEGGTQQAPDNCSLYGSRRPGAGQGRGTQEAPSIII